MSDVTPEPTKADCPFCNGKRSCRLRGEAKTTYRYDHGGGNETNGGATYSLLQCLGCDGVFYEDKSWSDQHEDVEYGPDGQHYWVPIYEYDIYPKPDSQIRPKWFEELSSKDWQLHRILYEVYNAIDQGSHILAAVGLRTTLDRATEKIGIDPAITFEEKLDALISLGLVGNTERAILEVIIDAGSAAAHRGWQPNRVSVLKLLTAVEAFLHRAFIVGDDALSVKASIPQKPTRRAPRAKKTKT
ncbi:DUF4145 domain-containing protein [Agrobacterium rosae]